MKTLLSALVGISLVTAISAAPVPLVGKAPVAVEKLRVDNSAILPMTGEWKFQIANGRMRGETFVSEINSVTASSEQNDHKAIDAFGGTNAFWWARRNSFPQWWQVDLGEMESVQALQ